jgi:hypothetical protein
MSGPRLPKIPLLVTALLAVVGLVLIISALAILFGGVLDIPQ